MEETITYVGLDVHKKTIAAAVGRQDSAPPEFLGVIENTPLRVARFARRLAKKYPSLHFYYEAGPCGYGLYRQLRALGYECAVIAPSLLPRGGGRIKTDKRDALQLVRSARAGDLTAVWVPDPSQEAMRDLSRAWEDMRLIERELKQRLSAFLLRHERRYPGRSHWGRGYFRWLAEQRFELPAQQIVFEEYVDAVRQAMARSEALRRQAIESAQSWSLRPAYDALQALRGFEQITALSLLAELGDLSRFAKPAQLMAYLGLVPSEHTSADKRRQGGITKSGNRHARRLLSESAWAYRFPARKTRRIQSRAERCPEAVQQIAWKAQKRLCGRYRRLLQRGKDAPVVATAIARELCGFVWAIAREAMTPAAPARR